MARTRPGKSAFLFLLPLVAALLALSACGGGHEAQPPFPTPPGGTTIPVHLFEYDTVAGTYIVNGELVTQDDVDRDLVGIALRKCHARRGRRGQGLGPLQDRRRAPTACCSPAAARTACSTAPAVCRRRRA